MAIPFIFARGTAPNIAINELLSESVEAVTRVSTPSAKASGQNPLATSLGVDVEASRMARLNKVKTNLLNEIGVDSPASINRGQSLAEVYRGEYNAAKEAYDPFVAEAAPLNLSKFDEVYGDNLGAPPRLMPTPRENPFSETAERIAENYNRELPDAIMGDLRFAEEHSLYSMHNPMLRGGFSDIYQTHQARTRGVDVEPITSSEQAQNIAQLISSRIGNVSNAPMGELKTLSTAERLAPEVAAKAATGREGMQALNLGNEARLQREQLLSGADVDNVNINSQVPRFSDPFDQYSTSLPTTQSGIGDLAGVDKVSRVSNLIGMEDIRAATSEKRFTELTTGIDPIKGYDEVAHNATNANVVEEVAGVTNPNKADDLFGVYDPARDPVQMGGLFGALGDDSAKGLLASAGIGAGVGAIGAYMTGGEASDGMIMGGIAGLGVRGISGAINANAAGIQRGMYKKILGEGFDSKMTQDQLRGALRDVNKETLNMGQKAMYGVLANPNKSSVGFSLRAQTLSGGFLAGAAFSSRRNDKRRGFNAHRGNRI